MKVPASTISGTERSYSSFEPSTQWIAAGWREFGHLFDPAE